MRASLNILKIVLISLVVTIAVYKYVPLNWIEPESDNLGSTITVINGSDAISASRSVINTNFANLNADKLENSAYYGTTTHSVMTTIPNLVSIGTITSGTWNGTTIAVAYGGTASTTLCSNNVILGNGASGFKCASGHGTSGMFLTSQGAGAAPIWSTSAVNLNDTYAWTNLHSFAATTTLATTTQWGVHGGISPVGSITAYASTTAPAGWLLADGSSLLRSQYPHLFAVIGYSYGGSGANFSLPDLRDRNIVMASSTPNIGITGGEKNHTLTIGEIPAHSHTYDVDTGNDNGGTDSLFGANNDVTDATRTTSSTGGGGSHNVMDPYIVLNYIIKY